MLSISQRRVFLPISGLLVWVDMLTYNDSKPGRDQWCWSGVFTNVKCLRLMIISIEHVFHMSFAEQNISLHVAALLRIAFSKQKLRDRIFQFPWSLTDPVEPSTSYTEDVIWLQGVWTKWVEARAGYKIKHHQFKARLHLLHLPAFFCSNIPTWIEISWLPESVHEFCFPMDFHNRRWLILHFPIGVRGRG